MAIIPAMTTGIMDFMINSGLITDIAAIPVPAFAVPYAAPRAVNEINYFVAYNHIPRENSIYILCKNNTLKLTKFILE